VWKGSAPTSAGTAMKPDRPFPMAAAKAAQRGGRHPVTPGQAHQKAARRRRTRGHEVIRADAEKAKASTDPVQSGKGPFVDGYCSRRRHVARASGRKDVIKTCRAVPPILRRSSVLTFGVYNGHNTFTVLVVTTTCVGTRLANYTHPTCNGHTGAGDKKANRGLNGGARKSARSNACGDHQAMALPANIRVLPQA